LAILKSAKQALPVSPSWFQPDTWVCHCLSNTGLRLASPHYRHKTVYITFAWPVPTSIPAALGWNNNRKLTVWSLFLLLGFCCIFLLFWVKYKEEDVYVRFINTERGQ
jgi:hypothetical protein